MAQNQFRSGALLMYQNNRNLFPVIAVLTAASIILGICGIAFVAVDKIGGEPRSVSNSAGQDKNPSPKQLPPSLPESP
jgi:hypothetical protein